MMLPLGTVVKFFTWNRLEDGVGLVDRDLAGRDDRDLALDPLVDDEVPPGDLADELHQDRQVDVLEVHRDQLVAVGAAFGGGLRSRSGLRGRSGLHGWRRSGGRRSGGRRRFRGGRSQLHGGRRSPWRPPACADAPTATNHAKPPHRGRQYCRCIRTRTVSFT